MKSSAASPLLLNCQFFSQEEYISHLARALHEPTLTHIVTLNAEMVVEAEHNQAFKQAVQQAELVIPDGSSILWARNFLTKKRQSVMLSLFMHLFSKEKPITGIESVFSLCDIAQEHNAAIYILGGTPLQAQGTLSVLQKKYPEVRIRITNENLPTDTQPGILLVAYGAPKQTLWIERHRKTLTEKGIRIAIGVGGAFAMISGQLPRAPKFLRTLHLEWLWRLILEPRRIGRIWNAVVVFPRIIQKGYPH